MEKLGVGKSQAAAQSFVVGMRKYLMCGACAAVTYDTHIHTSTHHFQHQPFLISLRQQLALMDRMERVLSWLINKTADAANLRICSVAKLKHY